MQGIFTVDKEIMTLLDMETRPILNLGEADPNCKLVDGALFKVSIQGLKHSKRHG